MEKQTEGTVISVKKQWWLKVRTKAFRKGPMDGAIFPHIVKVRYEVDGKEYVKSVWVHAGDPVPQVQDTVRVFYDADRHSKAKIR